MSLTQAPFQIPTRSHENFRYLPFNKVSWEGAQHTLTEEVFKTQLLILADRCEWASDRPFALEPVDFNEVEALFLDLHKTSRFDVLAQWNWQNSNHFKIKVTEDAEIQILVKGEVQQVPHILFDVQPGVKLTVLESVEAQKGFTNHFISYVCREGSELQRVLAQNSTLDSSQFFYSQMILEKDTVLKNVELSLGGHISRHNLNVLVVGENTKCELFGLYAPGSGQIHDHQPNVWHRSPGSTSSQYYKGLLAQSGRGNFTGRIEIDQVAQKTDSSQMNRNLLLSREAEINSKPELQVHADDVKAGHGASIGQLNADEIFYLQSRCITRDEAVHILSSAFGLEISENIDHPKLREFASSLIRKKTKDWTAKS